MQNFLQEVRVRVHNQTSLRGGLPKLANQQGCLGELRGADESPEGRCGRVISLPNLPSGIHKIGG
ncbi:hypothetical protein C4577_02640 [Candidatus Parcubacteria bacterium]|nr:MAG: hypothetical protein C4577_02640 [Candidatus Parcubacteria bacterium]